MRDYRDGWSVLVTAEHAGDDVPATHAHLFQGHEALVASHRGWDPGTRRLADTLSRTLGAPVAMGAVTRLLVDLNRSADNPRVFSELTRVLDRPEREALLERFHRPHWKRARELVSRGIARRGGVLHLGVHSFTPVLRGQVRRADLALLYDPARLRERELATRWAGALGRLLPDRVVRRNSPYRGNADGMTTAFRRSFTGSQYVGIEIEVNQRHLAGDSTFPGWVCDSLVAGLQAVLSD